MDDPEFKPIYAPFGLDITRGMVQDVWDCFVKPDQDAGIPQSGEMRVLMGILREAYRVLPETPDHPNH